MMRRGLVFIVFGLVFLSLSSHVDAVVRRRLPGKTATVKKNTTTVGTVGTTVRLRADRRALIINFSNLQYADTVSYTLTYLTNGKLEGLPGTIHVGSETATSRELLFGTCSSGTCVYHTNIVNARLEIRIHLKTGKTIVRRYKIKV